MADQFLRNMLIEKVRRIFALEKAGSYGKYCSFTFDNVGQHQEITLKLHIPMRELVSAEISPADDVMSVLTATLRQRGWLHGDSHVFDLANGSEYLVSGAYAAVLNVLEAPDLVAGELITILSFWGVDDSVPFRFEAS